MTLNTHYVLSRTAALPVSPKGGGVCRPEPPKLGNPLGRPLTSAGDSVGATATRSRHSTRHARCIRMAETPFQTGNQDNVSH